MLSDFILRKRIIFGGLTLLLATDIALAAYSWELSTTPRTPEQEFSQQAKQLEIMKADIKRAQKIKADVPQNQKDCDKFENSLFPASSGYSLVEAELGEIAKVSAVRIDDVGFHAKEIPNHVVANLSAIDIDVTVSGSYANIVRFVNGLQRSKNVYEVNSLSIASDAQTQGGGSFLKITLRMRTYFRMAA